MAMLTRNEVTEFTETELYNKCRNEYWAVWNKAKQMGRDVKMYLHWTAGRYTQFWDDYVVQIDYDGKIYVPDDTSFADTLAGTWRRNTAAINVAILGCLNANTKSLGNYAPTAAQLETLYQVVDTIAEGFDLTIDIRHVMTHGEAADNEDDWYAHDPYGPKSTVERWDLEYLGTNESPKYDPYDTMHRGGTIIRAKASWYRSYYNHKVYEYFNNSQDQIKKLGK